MRPILARLIHFCWSVLKWTLLVGVLGGAAAWFYLQQQLGEQIRQRVEAKLAQHYAAQGLRATVRAAELVSGRGIAVRDVSVVDPQASGPQAELLHVDELLLSCTTDLQELLLREPEVHQVTLRRVTVRATRLPNGLWSSGRLLPLPRFSERSPMVRLESGAVEMVDPGRTPEGRLHLRDLQLTLWPPDPRAPANAPRLQKVEGTLSGDLLHQVRFDGWIEPRQQFLDVNGAIEGLDVSPELRAALPGTLAGNWSELETLRAQVGAGFHLRYQPDVPVPLQYQVNGRLIRGRLDHPRLPHAVTDIQAGFRLSNEAFAIENLLAHSGSASLRLSCAGRGFGPNRPLTMQADLQQLELTPALLEILPEELRRQWMKYDPSGSIDASLRLSYDGQHWTPEASIQCSEVSFVADLTKFHYRLEHGRGTVGLKDDRLQMNLVAYAGSQPVELTADVQAVRTAPCGWVKAAGKKLALDERFFNALRGKPDAVIRSLNPRGTIDLVASFQRQTPQEPWHRFLGITLNQCGICYDEFPYPLSNIAGRLELYDGQWTFRDLAGTNGTGVVTCHGTMQTTPESPTAPARYALALAFTGKSVPLEGELRNALATRRPGLLNLWNCLNPHGTVDLSEVQVTSSTEQPQPNISFCIQPCEDASIEPSAFPYRLEKVRGTIAYRDRRATWEQCRAEHGETKIFADGSCELLADGGWHLRLQNMLLQHVETDRDMIQAMPEGLKRGILGLHPVGSCNLDGTFDLAHGGAAEAPLTSAWDVNVHFQQAAIDFGLKLENLSGSARLWGSHAGADYFCRGELRVDSLSYRDLQLTNVAGPLWLDAHQVLLGAWVDPALPGNRAPTAERRPLTADCFQGKAYTSAKIVLGELPQYEIQAQLDQVDLAAATQETLAGRQRSQGKIWARAHLQGAGRSLTDLSGRGELSLREANIYELPMMIALLKLLRVKQPDTNAFSQCDLAFTMQGPHIYLKPINFTGDAISLVGSGEMDLQSTVHLTLGARLGRPEERIPLLTDLLGGASEQILLIRVDGSLHNPEVTQVPFPGVNQALQQIQQDLQAAPAGNSKLSRLPNP